MDGPFGTKMRLRHLTSMLDRVLNNRRSPAVHIHQSGSMRAHVSSQLSQTTNSRLGKSNSQSQSNLIVTGRFKCNLSSVKWDEPIQSIRRHEAQRQIIQTVILGRHLRHKQVHLSAWRMFVVAHKLNVCGLPQDQDWCTKLLTCVGRRSTVKCKMVVPFPVTGSDDLPQDQRRTCTFTAGHTVKVDTRRSTGQPE